jgi:hypothetical protein
VHLSRLEPRDCPTSLVASVASFDPFPGYEGPIESVSLGDISVITADRIPHVKIFDHGQEIASFYAYDPAFNGGVNLATDGEYVATGTDRGAPHVREFTLHGVEVQSFFAGNQESLGGVRVSYPHQDDSPVSVSPDAKFQIYLDGASEQVTLGVADVLAGLNVGVTNRFPAQADPRRIATVIFGGSSDGPERGYAIVGGLFQQSEFTSLPARVFSEQLTEAQQIRAAAHEAAHLFGCFHIADPKSLMFEGITGGLEFDPLNLSILSQRLSRA